MKRAMYTKQEDSRILNRGEKSFREIAKELDRSTGGVTQRSAYLKKLKTRKVNIPVRTWKRKEVRPLVENRETVKPMIALVGSRTEITETLKTLFV